MPLPLILPALGWIASTAAGAFIVNTFRVAFMFGLKFFFTWVVVALGVGLVSYAGLKPIIDNLFVTIWDLMVFPPDLMPYLGMLNIDRVLTVWSSAVVMRMTRMALFSFKLNNLKLS